MMDLIIVIGSLILSCFMGGWGTSVLWAWFIVPIFNIHPINIPQAIGLVLFFRMIKGFSIDPNSEKQSAGKIAYDVFFQAFMVLFILCLGLIVKYFFM